MRRILAARLSIFLIVAATLGACSDSTAPTASLAGTYVATTYLSGTSAATAMDVLAAGGADTLVLSSDGRIAESAHIPAEIAGGGDLDITGTAAWSQDGETVTVVDPFADPRYEAATFVARGDSLSAEQVSGGAYVKLVLHRR